MRYHERLALCMRMHKNTIGLLIGLIINRQYSDSANEPKYKHVDHCTMNHDDVETYRTFWFECVLCLFHRTNQEKRTTQK